MKPGYKSTEFALTVLAIVVTILMASGLFGETGVAYKALAFASSTLAALGYTYGRSLVKAADSQAKALIEASKQDEQPPSP